MSFPSYTELCNYLRNPVPPQEPVPYEEYLQYVFPELLSTNVDPDADEHSLALTIRNLLNDVYQMTDDDFREAVIENVGGTEKCTKNYPDLPSVIDKILNEQTELKSLATREYLIIICFAMISLDYEMGDCDKIMRASSNENCHHRELYQLDAEEGFYRFVLYWNFEHSGQNEACVPYFEAKEMLPEVVKNIRDIVAQELEEIERVLSANDVFCEIDDTLTEPHKKMISTVLDSIDEAQKNLREKFFNKVFNKNNCTNNDIKQYNDQFDKVIQTIKDAKEIIEGELRYDIKFDDLIKELIDARSSNSTIRDVRVQVRDKEKQAQETINKIKESVNTIRERIEHKTKVNEAKNLLNTESDYGVSRAQAIITELRKQNDRRSADTSGQTSALMHNTAAYQNEVCKLVQQYSGSTFDVAKKAYVELAGGFIGEKDRTAVSIIVNALNDAERINANIEYFTGPTNARATRVDQGITAESHADERRDQHQAPRLSRALDPCEVVCGQNADVIARMINPRQRVTDSVYNAHTEEISIVIIAADSISGSTSTRLLDSLTAACGLGSDHRGCLENGVVNTTRRNLLAFAFAVGCVRMNEVEDILSLSGDRNLNPVNGNEALASIILAYLEYIEHLESTRISSDEQTSSQCILKLVRDTESRFIKHLAKETVNEVNDFFDEWDAPASKRSYSEIRRIVNKFLRNDSNASRDDVIAHVINQLVDRKRDEIINPTMIFEHPTITPTRRELYPNFVFCVYAVESLFNDKCSEGSSSGTEESGMLLHWLRVLSDKQVKLLNAWNKRTFTVEFMEINASLSILCGSIKEYERFSDGIKAVANQIIETADDAEEAINGIDGTLVEE